MLCISAAAICLVLHVATFLTIRIKDKAYMRYQPSGEILSPSLPIRNASLFG